jgi:hypothetical protein
MNKMKKITKSIKDLVLEDSNNWVKAPDIAKKRGLTLEEVESIIHNDDKDFYEYGGYYSMPELKLKKK